MYNDKFHKFKFHISFEFYITFIDSSSKHISKLKNANLDTFILAGNKVSHFLVYQVNELF